MLHCFYTLDTSQLRYCCWVLICHCFLPQSSSTSLCLPTEPRMVQVFRWLLRVGTLMFGACLCCMASSYYIHRMCVVWRFVMYKNKCLVWTTVQRFDVHAVHVYLILYYSLSFGIKHVLSLILGVVTMECMNGGFWTGELIVPSKLWTVNPAVVGLTAYRR